VLRSHGSALRPSRGWSPYGTSHHGDLAEQPVDSVKDPASCQIGPGGGSPPVPGTQLDPETVSTAVNRVLITSGFPEQPPMTGSRSGHLVRETVDPYRAELTLLIKDSVDAWVGVPA